MGGGLGKAFSSLPKPLPSLNPRWHSLDQNALARQNMPALQASGPLAPNLHKNIAYQSPSSLDK